MGRQRAGQRSRCAARSCGSSARPQRSSARVLDAADACAATLVGRAALGSSYVELDPEARRAVCAPRCPHGRVPVVLDAPAARSRAARPVGRGRRARRSS